MGGCCSHCSLAPTPPTRLSLPARPPAHPSAQIQEHPCLPFLGGYSQHSQSPQWVEPVHPSLLPHCSLSSNHASLKKIVWDRQKDSLPEAPPVPSDVAAPFSWRSAARRQPLNRATPSGCRTIALALPWSGRQCRRPCIIGPPFLQGPPPGPPSKTTPKFTWVLEANPSGTEGFLRHFRGSLNPPKCAS